MTDERDFFTPEQVDQQVEQLSPDSPIIRLPRRRQTEQAPLAEERLMSDLQGYYQAEQAQDLLSLERAWQRVSPHLASTRERSRSTDQSSPSEILRSSHERTRMMRKHVSDPPQRGKFLRRLNALAAVLVAALLVGGMAVVFKLAHSTPTAHRQSQTHTASALTPTPPALQAVPSSPGLYLITQADTSENSQVTKVDKDTGAVLWNHFVGTSESSTIVADNIVFGASGDKNAYGGTNAPDDHSYVYALNAQNGSQLWRTDLGADYIVTDAHPPVVNGQQPSVQGYNLGVLTTPTFADGVIYVTSGAGKVYALNAASGTIIWTTDVHATDYDLVNDTAQTVQSLAVENGVVYGATFNKLYALNAQNGHEIWSVSASSGYSFGSPTEVDGKVYLSLAPPSTHTEGNTAQSYIVAYSADHGDQLWKSDGYYWAGFLNTAPVVENGLVYVANVYTGIYALDSQTGHTRWQHVLGTNAFTNSDGCSWPVVANGVVYANCGTFANPQLYAYNATNGNVIWSRTSAANPDAASNGVIYGTNFPGLVSFIKTTNGTTFFHQTYGQITKDKFGNASAPEPNLTLVP